MAEFRKLGVIDINILYPIFGNIFTNEIIVSSERLEHIKKRHPQDYLLFEKYGADTVRAPNYIICDTKNKGTIFMVLSLKDTNLNVIVRVVLDTDNENNKNSVMTFYRVSERIFEVETVLLRTLWVKRNAGGGTPAKYSLLIRSIYLESYYRLPKLVGGIFMQ